MHINQLIYFLAAAESGSINAAAKQCYVSQQAINLSLGNLETELRTHLFERSHTGVHLTPQGHIFAAAARDMLDRYQKALTDLEHFETADAQFSGTLTIFSASIFTEQLLPDVINGFNKLYPHVLVKIIETNPEEIIPFFLHDYCDLAFLSAAKPYFENTLQQDWPKDAQFTMLLEDRRVMVTMPDHPLSRQKSVNYKILLQYFGNSRPQVSLYQTLPVTRVKESYENCVSNSSNVELHKKLLRDNGIITFMPHLAYLQQFQSDGFVSVDMTDTPPVWHVMLYRDDDSRPNHQLLQRFLLFVDRMFTRRFGRYKN